jgi:ferredoxin
MTSPAETFDRAAQNGPTPPAIRTQMKIGDVMKVEVDLAKCTGHGICESIADDVFEVQDDGSVLIHDGERPESDRERMQQAVTQCPAAALSLVD